MNRLINTELFSILEKANGTFTPETLDITPACDDFAHSVISLCTSAKEGVPAYFTLHHTRLKLEEFRNLLTGGKVGKKCGNTK